MVHSIRQFSGKRMDEMIYMLRFMMGCAGGEKIYAPECLAFRPFFKKYAEGEKSRFIKSYVSAAEGFSSFFSLCGGLEEYVKILPDVDSLLESLDRNDFKLNPIIIGSLNKKKIWSRADTLFYDNKSCFIIVIGKSRDKYFFHDPQGIPCCMIDEELLRECVNQAGEDIISIEMGGLEYRNNIGLWEDFLFRLKEICINVQQDAMSGGNAWKVLRALLEEELSSSAHECLFYNIMEIQQACRSIREFFSLNAFIPVEREKCNLLEKYMQQYECCCADIMEGLLKKDINSTRHHIEKIMCLEDELLTLYFML